MVLGGANRHGGGMGGDPPEVLSGIDFAETSGWATFDKQHGCKWAVSQRFGREEKHPIS